jgi:hypothetical protein
MYGKDQVSGSEKKFDVCISINTKEQPTSSPLCNSNFKMKNVTCNQCCGSGSLNPDPGFYNQKFKKDAAGNFLNIFLNQKLPFIHP